MNNFFKASLLAMVFVGMSSFSTVEDYKITSSQEIQSDENCEKLASDLYLVITIFAPHTSQEVLTETWFDAYWTCLDSGGSSDFTANP